MATTRPASSRTTLVAMRRTYGGVADINHRHAGFVAQAYEIRQDFPLACHVE